MPGRNGALLGTTIKLVAKFKDANGNPVDPDVSPTIDIFPAGKNPNEGSTTDGDAIVLDASQTSLGSPAGANYIVRDAVGCYSYEFPIPPGGNIGIYFDRWNGSVTSQPLEEVFMFAVVGGGSIATGQLQENNRVTICVDGDLLDEDSNPLGDETCWYFTTTYNPLYSSVRRLRMELGSCISNIPDDTLNLNIFEASLYADGITFANDTVNDDYFKFARREYVTCLAASRILGCQGSHGGKQKRLGDLDIKWGSDTDDRMKAMMKCLSEYEPAIKSRGEMSAGTGLKPRSAVKGITDPDRPVIGRLWVKEADGMPAANSKVKSATSNRPKRTFLKRKSRWDWE
jgi:hypothetical protein